jgi:hypothetical protein
MLGGLLEQEYHGELGTARESWGSSLVPGGVSCGHDPARASWMFRTFHDLEQDHYWGEQA